MLFMLLPILCGNYPFVWRLEFVTSGCKFLFVSSLGVSSLSSLRRIGYNPRQFKLEKLYVYV